MGNILTKAEVHKITLKQKGGSTLGGREVWFDRDVLRLNYDGRGELLGEFFADDLILVARQNGEFYTSNFDLSNHYEDNILVIEKFNSNKVWSAVLYDADQDGKPYLKRFTFEETSKKMNFLGDNANSSLVLLTDEVYPRIEVTFGGHDSFREPMVVDAEEFIAVKSYKAKGKRLTTYEISTVNELEPVRFPTQEQQPEDPVEIDPNSEEEKSPTDILDEIIGQRKLFD